MSVVHSLGNTSTSYDFVLSSSLSVSILYFVGSLIFLIYFFQYKYLDIPQEESCGSLAIPEGWPHQGWIEFQNVTLRYLPSLPPALCDLSFTIPGGTQVSLFAQHTGCLFVP